MTADQQTAEMVHRLCAAYRAKVAALREENKRLRVDLTAAEEYGEECLSRMGGVW